MATEQSMSKAIAKAVAEAMRVAIEAMAEAAAEPKIGGPAKKQPTFNWDAKDKYRKLKTFRLDVNNILSTYDTPQMEQLAMVKKLVGKKGRQLLETLTNAEKVTGDTLEGLFYMLTSKVRP